MKPCLAALATSLGLAAAAHRCHFFNTHDACLAAKEPAPCLWCKSAAVPSMCYDQDEASQLPPGVFECDKAPAAAPVYVHDVTRLVPVEEQDHGCHFYNQDVSCLKGKEGGKPCYWCKSAAVASTCYSEAEAQQLPPAIFQCDKGLTESFWLDASWKLTTAPTTAEAMDALFGRWKAEFAAEYASAAAEAEARRAFAANAARVAMHNSQVPRPSYSLELNAFADMTWAQFRANYLGATPQDCSATHSSTVPVVDGVDVPEAMDWRRVDAVSPVKNQGKCGSCWTFSTTGCLESHNLLKHGKRILLSEQNLVDCAQAFDNHGCNGGLPSHAFEYIKYNGGLDTGAAYPYHAQDETCKYDPSHIGVQVLDVVNITSRDETQLKTAVGTVGPVSIAFQVADDFAFYKDGVYDSTVCKSGEKDVNHAVLAVGYNTTSDGTKFWIVKNSWTAKWGIDGYFHIARDKNMCGLADCASYPIV